MVFFIVKSYSNVIQYVDYYIIISIFSDAFDREFTLSCGQLGHREKNRMRVYDRNPNMRTIWARKLFSELLLE